MEDDGVSREGANVSPFDTASCFSFVTFGYASDLLAKGYKSPLQQHELDALPSCDNPVRVTNALEDEWQSEAHAEGSLWRALYRANTPAFWLTGIYAWLESSCAIAQPVVSQLDHFSCRRDSSPTVNISPSCCPPPRPFLSLSPKQMLNETDGVC